MGAVLRFVDEDFAVLGAGAPDVAAFYVFEVAADGADDSAVADYEDVFVVFFLKVCKEGSCAGYHVFYFFYA